MSDLSPFPPLSPFDFFSGYRYKSSVPFILPKERHCERVFPKIKTQWHRGGLSASCHNPLSSAISISPRSFRFASSVTLSFVFYRKVQDALEKQNREKFKKRDHEKRKVDEATEKAKELMRVKLFFSLNAARVT